MFPLVTFFQNLFFGLTRYFFWETKSDAEEIFGQLSDRILLVMRTSRTQMVIIDNPEEFNREQFKSHLNPDLPFWWGFLEIPIPSSGIPGMGISNPGWGLVTLGKISSDGDLGD